MIFAIFVGLNKMVMEKRVIKSLIIEKQNEIPTMEIMPRKLELEETCNYVFVGLRRAGKSYLMFQHIQELLLKKEVRIEEILYINFEDERIADIKVEELGLIVEAYHELYSYKPRIYLDEIQNIKGWEKFVRRLADSKYRIFITGSNAQMLSKEIYTTLGGRFIAKEIYPFSFPEYLKYQHFDLVANWEYNLKVKAELVKKFETYFYFGGFAETFPLKDKRSWLNSLFQKILLGDVISRNDIRNESSIRLIVKKLAESIMQPLALARILGVIKSAGCSLSYNTLVDYLQYLNDAYLIFGISNFSDKLSEKESITKRLTSLYEDKYNEVITIDTYKELAKPYEEKLKEINLSIDNNQMRKYEVKCKLNELPDYTKKIKKLLDLNKPKKELVHSLIDRIVIDKDRVITIQYKYGVIPDNTFTYQNLNLARNPYGRKGKSQYNE